MRNFIGASIRVTGTVQGVGFRPFIYNLANRYHLKGWVKNTSASVAIEVGGHQDSINNFINAIRSESPPLARIRSLEVDFHSPGIFTTFEISNSESLEGDFQPIPPDVGICPDCLGELFDLSNRRYLYPFINCTNCGPRFTIIKDLPYDRPYTTMGKFTMCSDCSSEYNDPSNRRFHAQPIACKACGPKVWLQRRGEKDLILSEAKAIHACREMLLAGQILAIKGLGGFHLACDASNPLAVRELRRRKLRVDKPFAVMMNNIDTVRIHCEINTEEEELLESHQRPIVLIKKKGNSSIDREVSPGQDTLGVMLPYTPLHYLLMAEIKDEINALIMTSGNLSEEPIAYRNEDALNRLDNLCDAYLLHDRDIHMRCDDSVARVINFIPQGSFVSRNNKTRAPFFFRRSRGYAPEPIQLPVNLPNVLAVGPEIKNTFCLTRERMAFVSHFIGDMENYETLDSFKEGIRHYERLFRINPEVIARDIHPDYLSTKYALERSLKEDLPIVDIQHHHAHIASCMADNQLLAGEKVIGLSFDGTGFGTDGAIWGGEILIADYLDFNRIYHLQYFPLPGGDASIKQPARVALALLWSLGINWDVKLAPVKHFSPEELANIQTQLERSINTPYTSSLGRLFDAIAALAGIRQIVNYEAQAAMELESIADKDESKYYQFEINQNVISLKPGIINLVKDLQDGISIARISAKFHNGIVQLVRCVCNEIRQKESIAKVCLSGGVWQNATLLEKTVADLKGDGFEVYAHLNIPTNDGGISLGQAVVAGMKIR